jgi:hypothetical protein
MTMRWLIPILVFTGCDTPGGPSARCGNQICESGESQSSCCQDCGCGAGQTCTSGRCMASQPPPPTCTKTGSSCSVQDDCCDFQTGNGYCIDFGSGGRCADSCHANSDCTSGCCQTADDGSQICSPASNCSNLFLGAPCNSDAQCASKLCVNGGSGQGWCSERCTSSLDCPNSPVVMWCGQNSSGSSICWSRCSSDADCLRYGPGSACRGVSTVENTTELLCVG